MDGAKNGGRLRWLCAALAALLAAMLVMNFARSEQLDAANDRLSAVYQKAFYETCELTEAVAANYRKLLAAGDAAQMQALLGEISRETQGASGNLALLPLGQETISATIKFINQAEDFAESLSRRLATGGAVGDADYETIASLADAAAQFSAGMGELLLRFERGELRFTADDFSETGRESLYPITGEAASYPTLLYDGPFSDGASVGSFRMLEDMPELSQQQAGERLRDLLGAQEMIFTGESTPEVPCYEFRLRSGEGWLNAGVTKRGGQLLYLLPETGEGDALLSEEQLYSRAEEFLRRAGYGEMEMSYSSRFGGILTINYAAVQDGAVLYSDLVKLQLSMRDGRVVGLDAKSYLKNHVPRSIAAPKISQQEAMQRVSARLTPLSARLCVIPQDGAEYLCYEIAAADAGGDFLLYIDALTGVERELMQVISMENGTLVM